MLEVDIAGPGYEARGVTSAPFPGYVFIGRREDFGFTLTSAGADIIDHFVETLCGGSDTKYLYKGRCRDMERFDAGKLTGTDGETRPVVFNRTVHGPVIGYANVGGRRVAISRKRASYGRDTEDQLLYRDVTKGRIDGPRDLFRAASQSPQTFNTFYVDRRNIAMYTSGSLPLRAKSVDSGLPVDGRGDYEWRGRLSASKHPQGINPRSGLIVNWNNKPAAEFPGADDQFGYGTVGRVDLLNGRMNEPPEAHTRPRSCRPSTPARPWTSASGSFPFWPRSCAPGRRPAPARRKCSGCWRRGGTRAPAASTWTSTARSMTPGPP